MRKKIGRKERMLAGRNEKFPPANILSFLPSHYNDVHAFVSSTEHGIFRSLGVMSLRGQEIAIPCALRKIKKRDNKLKIMCFDGMYYYMCTYALNMMLLGAWESKRVLWCGSFSRPTYHCSGCHLPLAWYAASSLVQAATFALKPLTLPVAVWDFLPPGMPPPSQTYDRIA